MHSSIIQKILWLFDEDRKVSIEKNHNMGEILFNESEKLLKSAEKYFYSTFLSFRVELS